MQYKDSLLYIFSFFFFPMQFFGGVEGGISPPLKIVLFPLRFRQFSQIFFTSEISNTIISLFSSWKYFRTALVGRKFVTRILLHYKYFSPSKIFLIRLFRTGARTHGVNSQRCEVELNSAAGYLCFSAHDGNVP